MILVTCGNTNLNFSLFTSGYVWKNTSSKRKMQWIPVKPEDKIYMKIYEFGWSKNDLVFKFSI
jgi:translation initiation factor IF-1